MRTSIAFLIIYLFMGDVWVSKSRKTGLTHEYFEKGFISMGWPKLPDLSKINTKTELAKIYEEYYPGERKMQLAIHVGQIWKFVKEAKIGDFLIFPNKEKSTVHVGKITGDYNYLHENPILKQNRKVSWINEYPRSTFDLDLLNSFGSLLTFARVRKDKAFERITRMVEGKNNSIQEIGESDELFYNLETEATDRIIKFIEQKFSGHPLADIINEILIAKGFVTKVSEPGPDGGVDIMASPIPLGFNDPRIIVQVKSSSKTEDVKVLRELGGVINKFNAEFGILAIWGGLTRAAQTEADDSFFSIRIWDQLKIVNEILSNYDTFSDEMKIKLPLKQIWSLVEETDD